MALLFAPLSGAGTSQLRISELHSLLFSVPIVVPEMTGFDILEPRKLVFFQWVLEIYGFWGSSEYEDEK